MPSCHFVDGPHHGLTKAIDRAEIEIKVLSQPDLVVASPHDTLQTDAPAFKVAAYRRLHTTQRGTVIYEYQGDE